MSDAGDALIRSPIVAKAIVLAVGILLTAIMLYSAILQIAGGPARGLEAGGTVVPQTSLVRLRDAGALLVRQPLSPVPFIVAAEDAAARRDIAAAARLYEQALLRDPRNVSVRLWLAERYLKQAEFADAVAQLDAVMRMRPNLRRKLVTAIVPLVGNTVARRAVAEALAQNPPWKADFLDIAVRNAMVAPAYYELLYGLGGHRGFLLSDFELSRTVTTALSRGDTESARILYSRFVPRPAADPDNLVFDPDFRGAAGPPPFNWQFVSATSGYALIKPRGPQGRLDVHVFGGEPAILATQRILVAPGLYLLSATAARDSADAVDGLSWRLICDRTRVELGRLAIAGASDIDPVHSAAIVIPPLCPVVSLVLAYAPPLRPVLGTAALASVTLAPADATGL